MNYKIIFAFIALMFAFACEKDSMVLTEDMNTVGFRSDICGEPEVFTLWGGKTINVGTVTVSNDEMNLYVTYQTTGDWYLKEVVHLYVLNYEPMERLTPGQAPFKAEGLNTQSYTFTVPFADLDFTITCDMTYLWLQAHAAVEKIVDGEVVQGETAYGGDIVDNDQGSWYGNIKYLVKCCEEEPPCYEFQDETAWAAGNRYVAKGNWATYTPYVEEGTVTLFAGQTINVGSIHFSAVSDGYVTITITLTGEWVFAPDEENVKIQDYEFAPSASPSPGLFDYKGTAEDSPFSIEVPANNFYGIHLDVGKWIEVPCED